MRLLQIVVSLLISLTLLYLTDGNPPVEHDSMCSTEKVLPHNVTGNSCLVGCIQARSLIIQMGGAFHKITKVLFSG